MGTYRFWRDIGYAVGAVVSGLFADAFSIPFAITAVGIVAVASAFVGAVRMYETGHTVGNLHAPKHPSQ